MHNSNPPPRHARPAICRPAALALVLLVAGLLIPAMATSASAAPISQCNGISNVGGQAVACDVTVVNTLDLATGETSSTVSIRVCSGAANAPLTCTTTTTTFDELTTSVSQCNGSGNGGGGAVTCTVRITNNIIGTATTSPATIDQCNGSGAGGGVEPTVACDPAGNTVNATITQCNNSGNGGGGTMRVRCTVTTSTQTSVLPVLVNQCNGSGNGGGATVTCTVSLTNNVDPAPGPDNPGPDNPGPDNPGPDNPGPDNPGPDTAAPGRNIRCDGVRQGTFNNVHVRKGDTCILVDSRVNGDLTSNYGRSVLVFDTTIVGNVNLDHLSGDVRFGNKSGCRYDPTVGGNLTVRNSHNVLICQTTVSKTLSIRNNDGRISVAQSKTRRLEVVGNRRFEPDGRRSHARESVIRLRSVNVKTLLIKSNEPRKVQRRDVR